MGLLALTGTAAAITALIVAVGMLVLFITETYPPEVVAVTGAAVMIVLGIVPADLAAASFANPAPWTIAGMFILVGALVRTGGLDALGRVATTWAKNHPRLTLVGIGLGTAVLSAFLNNTPLVVVLMPVYVQLARSLGVAPSKVLIPLSYFAILGGGMTMIGTSTNLIVDGVWAQAGFGHFGIFEIMPLGVLMLVVGTVYLALFANRLLPARDPAGPGTHVEREFLTELLIVRDSPLIGLTLSEVAAFKRSAITVIDVIRGYDSLRWNLAGVRIEAGDRIVLRSPMGEMLTLRDHRDLRPVDKVATAEMTVVEALITPGCRMVERTMGSLHLRRRYGVYVVAMHRHNHDHPAGTLRDLVVQVGDLLVLAGRPADINRMVAEMELVEVDEPSERPFRRTHVPIVIACLLAVVTLSALNIAPIFALVLLAVAIVLITRCIDSREALGFVDGRLLFLLVGMLIVGEGLHASGALQLLVGGIAPILQHAPPWVIVAALYLLASALTELITNNAVALILTPLAIVLAGQLGVDPKPVVIAVMMGASASFATPIGYQTNTLVYGPGGYKFLDFARIGIPLHLVLTVVVAVAIPLLWPLDA
ncbi:SLC13 family permease [Enemella sp. A6]|uniref:SLC13 family permease n=1 Tax=Enemella sp. A6 TaxID=3440152 RepID=UPI003EB70EB1